MNFSIERMNSLSAPPHSRPRNTGKRYRTAGWRRVVRSACLAGVLAAADDWGDQGLATRIERAGGELAGLVAGRAAAAPADPFADVVPFETLLRANAT